MPRIETVTRTLYKFDELSDRAKEKALDNLYDINVSHEWWDFTYEDAARIGLKITGFDIDRGSYLKGNLTLDPVTVARNIIKDHGRDCETFKVAELYLFNFANLTHDSEEYENIAEEFERDLKEEYLSMLRQEYEYLTSKESIIETIQANDYEFTEDGKLA